MQVDIVGTQNATDTKPGVGSILRCECPRCRRGHMFKQKNPYAKKFMEMNETCDVCGQPFDIEVGFYFGSGFVSYGIMVALSAITFILWLFIIGMSANDNRVFAWLIFNSILILALQPPVMRISRTGWLAFFVHYDPNWKITAPEKPERINESQKNNW